MSKVDEIGASRLAMSPPSLAQKLEDAQVQAEIQSVMRDVISGNRDNVHCVSTSMLPERPSVAPQSKDSGWADRVPLSNPDGTAQCDRLVEAFEAMEKAEKKR